MDRVFTVNVKDWWNNWVIFSIHKSKEGADNAVAEADKCYGTTTAYVDERNLRD